ncbi:hypothetical protein H2200_011522 [Cladophialophora chaetospira]|uniref:Uncharacterized protein n=1 Tax=Cladophialophora chaetospira TaxID=386627 RepID=A0AA38WZH9_9EURO|nr:hypothetical protein H2200_011522 [Cladophialophora chaetospira]
MPTRYIGPTNRIDINDVNFHRMAHTHLGYTAFLPGDEFVHIPTGRTMTLNYHTATVNTHIMGVQSLQIRPVRQNPGDRLQFVVPQLNGPPLAQFAGGTISMGELIQAPGASGWDDWEVRREINYRVETIGTMNDLRGQWNALQPPAAAANAQQHVPLVPGTMAYRTLRLLNPALVPHTAIEAGQFTGFLGHLASNYPPFFDHDGTQGQQQQGPPAPQLPTQQSFQSAPPLGQLVQQTQPTQTLNFVPPQTLASYAPGTNPNQLQPTYGQPAPLNPVAGIAYQHPAPQSGPQQHQQGPMPANMHVQPPSTPAQQHHLVQQAQQQAPQQAPQQSQQLGSLSTQQTDHNDDGDNTNAGNGQGGGNRQ